jgi:hypothetical protein
MTPRFWGLTLRRHSQNGECVRMQMHVGQQADQYRVPPNCRFELDDIEQEWAWKENSFDFIFARDLILAIRDWPRLIDQIYT